MFNFSGKRLLVVSPHTDDAELGCGATIYKLSQVNEVHIAAFSTCNESLPPQFPKDTLLLEATEASKVLNIAPNRLHIFDFQVRHFATRRQDILDQLIKLRKDISPHVVLIPSRSDVHQDHATVHAECIRAFKTICILGYELPWNQFNIVTSSFSVLSELDVKKKIEAISKYVSQKHRPYAQEDFLYSLAKIRGLQSGVTYAESFEHIRSLF